MLFNFNLLPLNQIAPWGYPDKPDDQHLHWFGLTEGEYWLDVGDSKLFEYSEQLQALEDRNRYCPYYVVRFHEDLLEMAPHILEPVPPSLVPYISGEHGRAWQATAAAWLEASNEENETACSDWYDKAVLWIGARQLDCGYLREPPNIYFWSDEITVHIEWDNSQRIIDGQPVWSATRGSYHLSRDAFLQEVRSFHDRLMQQMSERLEQVIAGMLPAEIEVDLPELKRQHMGRERSLERSLAPPAPAIDWKRIREAIRQMKEARV